MEVDTGVVHPHAKEHLGHRKLEGTRKALLPELSEGAWPACTLAVAFWLPHLERMHFFCFHPLGLWSFITAPWEKHTRTWIEPFLVSGKGVSSEPPRRWRGSPLRCVYFLKIPTEVNVAGGTVMHEGVGLQVL